LTVFYLGRNLVVHGLTMDEDGRKMSKSIGNVVDPDVVIHGGKVGSLLARCKCN